MRAIVRLIVAAVAMAAALPHTEAAAETIKVAVLVESLGEATAACGITKDSLHTAAAFPLQTSDFEVVEPGSADDDFTAYVNVNAVKPRSDFCAASIEVRFYFYSLVKNPWGSETVFRQVEICSAASLLVEYAGTFASLTDNAVERHTKTCIVEMKKKMGDSD